MECPDLMEIYVVRHGDAGKRMDNARSDASRSLSVAGRKDVETLAKLLGILGIEADYLISSGLHRASETADILMNAMPRKTKRMIWNELSPDKSHESLLARISTLQKDSTVIVVGHNPFLQKMISSLVSGVDESRIDLKKCGIARIDVADFIPVPRGELKWLLTPKLERRASGGGK